MLSFSLKTEMESDGKKLAKERKGEKIIAHFTDIPEEINVNHFEGSYYILCLI